MSHSRSCERWQIQLDRLIDDLIEQPAAVEPQDGFESPDAADRSAERKALLAHLDDCAECRQVRRDLEAVVAKARDLPAGIEPPQDLWPAIAAQLEDRSPADEWSAGSTESRPEAARRPRLAGRWLGLAASVLVALLAVVMVVNLLRNPIGTLDSPDAGMADGSVESSPGGSTPADSAKSVGRSEGSELAERLRLSTALPVSAALEPARSRLPAEALAAFEMAQAQIAAARQEIVAALDETPGDPRLLQRLAVSYRFEARLIETLLTLPNPRPKEIQS